MSTSATPSEEQINRCNYYSDLYKEIYNIRPRWLSPAEHTVEEWDRLISSLHGEYTVQHED